MIKKFGSWDLRFWIPARPEKFAKIAKTKDLSKFSDFDQAVHNEKKNSSGDISPQSEAK